MLKKHGDWNRAWKAINSLQPFANRARIETLKQLAQKGQMTVLQHIILQDLNWTALSQATISRKGHDRFLIDTFTYLNNISSFSDDSIAKVGVRTGVSYKDGTTLEEVARKNEEGFDRTPARELWRPSSNEVRAWQRSGVNNPSKILFNLLKTI